jgi:hypothetical protein
MKKPDIKCVCCGRYLSPDQYLPRKSICALCNTLDANEAAVTTAATWQREHIHLTETREGRRQAKQLAKLETYSLTGKRCSACHHHKSIEAYGACATRGDGLQPICKACNKIRVSIVENGGAVSQWHMIRDALRQSAPGPLNLLAESS